MAGDSSGRLENRAQPNKFDNFNKWRICFTRREANLATDTLARHSLFGEDFASGLEETFNADVIEFKLIKVIILLSKKRKKKKKEGNWVKSRDLRIS